MEKSLVSALLLCVLAYVYKSTGKTNNNGVFTSNLKASYDYIVVGAGSSGSVVASRLSEEPGNDVILLEAGGSDEDHPDIFTPSAVSKLLHTDADWEYYTLPQKHSCLAQKKQRSYWPRGRVMGGTGSLNWMAYVRGNRHDFDRWAAEGCDGWSYKDVLPYFVKSEDIQIDEFKNSRFCWHQATIKNGERWSSYRSFVKPHLDRSNLHVVRNILTTKVIIKDKKAIGVECIRNGKKVKVFARKEVILSAGAVNSPQILMLSGIGPRKHLQELGIPAVTDLPVGENLQDHITIHLVYSVNVSGVLTFNDLTSTWTAKQYEYFRTGPLSTTSLEAMAFVYKDFDKKKDSGDNSDIQLMTYSIHGITPSMREVKDFNYREDVTDTIFTGTDDTRTIILAPTLMHPKSTGTIRLKSSDPFDYPVIDPHYLEHPDDVKTLIAGIRFAEQLVGTKTFQSIRADVNFRSPYHKLCSQHDFRSDAFWECYVRHYGLTVSHQSTTCRMGSKDDPTAVVDPQLRVKGISGLRVADASVMRNVPAGNTNAPAIMVGEKAADMIRNG